MNKESDSVNTENKTKLKKTSVFGSVMFRAWFAFFVLAACILIFFWTGELLIFTTNYTKSKIERLEEKSASLASSLRNNQYSADAASFRNAARSTAINQRMTIIVFTFADGADVKNPYEANVLYYTDPVIAESSSMTDFQDARSLIGEDFLQKMDKIPAIGQFVMRREKSGPFNLVYGEKMISDDGRAIYFYSSVLIMEYDSTVEILVDQLKGVTVICVIFAVVVSFIIAWLFSKPIRNFTATAKRIGAGDRTAKYEGNGYNEFDDLADALNGATYEMIKAENLRRDFLANVSHDLRTPLTLVKANAEMVRDISGDNKEKRNRNIQTIINEADRLTMLVEDILDLSKLQSGVVDMKKEEVNISLVAEDVLSQFSVLIETNGYCLEKEISSGVIVECDYKRLTQVIYNLVGNAINYVGEDKKVIVSLAVRDEKVRMEVTDHGKGIAQEEKDRVWDRYYRSNQNKRNVVGSGIGLSIVKNILIGFNAEYGVDSAESAGSTFWFELPVLRIEEYDKNMNKK